MKKATEKKFNGKKVIVHVMYDPETAKVLPKTFYCDDGTPVAVIEVEDFMAEAIVSQMFECYLILSIEYVEELF